MNLYIGLDARIPFIARQYIMPLYPGMNEYEWCQKTENTVQTKLENLMCVKISYIHILQYIASNEKKS